MDETSEAREKRPAGCKDGQADQPDDLTAQLRTSLVARLASGISLRQVSRDSGVDYRQLHRFRRATQTLGIAAAGRLAAALGLRLR